MTNITEIAPHIRFIPLTGFVSMFLPLFQNRTFYDSKKQTVGQKFSRR